MQSTELERIIADADRCVKCAVCLPYCPTYGLSGSEAESPRGRVALMRAWADGSQPLNPGLERHLDQCLACRNCEPVCPAQVPYGRLLDNARAAMADHRRRPWTRWLGNALVRRRLLLRATARLAGFARAVGLARLIPPLRRLHRPVRPWAWRDAEPDGAPRGTVGLFIGCVADVLDAETHAAATRLLAAAGYRVRVPAAQTCCGALHQHSGDALGARELREANRRAFDGLDHVLSTATGCGAQLEEHVLPDRRHEDACSFLSRTGGLDALEFRPLQATVAVHLPCTRRNVLGDTESPHELLSLVPGLRLLAAPETPRCCGAAGSYVLEHPAIADALGDELASKIAAEPPDYLATTNIGCALHLADQLARLGAPTRVLHPLALLARQLPAGDAIR